MDQPAFGSWVGRAGFPYTQVTLCGGWGGGAGGAGDSYLGEDRCLLRGQGGDVGAGDSWGLGGGQSR